MSRTATALRRLRTGGEHRAACAARTVNLGRFYSVHSILTALARYPVRGSLKFQRPNSFRDECPVMLAEIIAVIESMGATMMRLLPTMLVLGVVFAVLTHFWACNPGRPWWRKRELATDLCYWVFVPLVARFFRIGLLILAAAWLFGIHTPEDLVAFYDDGHGPLPRFPLWVQVAIFLVASDFIMY